VGSDLDTTAKTLGLTVPTTLLARASRTSPDVATIERCYVTG